MPPLEAWERVLVDPEAVSSGTHGAYTCTQCHGGVDTDDMETAHEGLISDPSDGPDNVCTDCHSEIAQSSNGSLHSTLAGYDTVLHERAMPEEHPAIETMEANHCNSCHASCGQCHVSQPASVGGGLLEGHAYIEKPPMTRTCTGCHGSRVKDEYTGRNEGYPADVHFTQGRMNCVDCHIASEMHGETGGETHRYAGDRVPTCEICHPTVLSEDTEIIQHQIHGDTLSCQVCHSVSYKNCSNCHVQQSEEGVAFYQIDPSWMDFRIGLNPSRTDERPWKYILLRHVPISRTSFEYYGIELLNFDNRPTWVEATPHNIQRNTPQTSSCDNCHGNPQYFLTPDVVLEDELEANAPVIVQQPPE